MNNNITLTVVLCLLVHTIVFSQIKVNEVYYDHPSSDGGFEWVEIFNTTATDYVMPASCIANGGTSYSGVLDIPAGTIVPADGFLLVGGPTSDVDNGSPVYDIAMEFSPNLQNGGTTADAVALYEVPCIDITTTSPIDVIVYGTTNTNGLIDETGMIAPVDVEDGNSGESVGRTPDGAEFFEIFTALTPGSANGIDNDTDNDGIDNTIDNCPNDPNPGQGDLDNDGIGDACDSDNNVSVLLESEEAIFVNELGSGVILKSIGGICFLLKVNDAGDLETVQVTCPN